MKVLQIIDTLEAGGAEKIALNIANVLSDKGFVSGLVSTRAEGTLKAQIADNVLYTFINKKYTFDVFAIFRLRTFVKKHQFDIIHAHGTSFFTGVLLKLICWNLKIVWHDHYGKSDKLELLPKILLFCCKYFFKGIIAVNHKLVQWNIKNLKFKNTIFLPNFTFFDTSIKKITILNGVDGYRIVCVANLRPIKNHFGLLNIAQKTIQEIPNVSFHLVGKNFEDKYSESLKECIQKMNLEKNVFLYGSKEDISNILDQASIAILTSHSEGLPVALLEYGLKNKIVVSTAVGEIPTIIEHQKNGFVIERTNENLFAKTIIKILKNLHDYKYLGDNLNQTILQNYSIDAFMDRYIVWLSNL